MTERELILIFALVISSGLAVWFWWRLRQKNRPEHAMREAGQSHHLSPTRNCFCARFLGGPSIASEFPQCPRTLLGTHTHETAPPVFDAVASALDAGLVLIGTEQRVCFLNSQAEELLSVTGERVQGRRLIQLIRDYQVEAMVQEVFDDGEVRAMTIHSDLNERTLRLHCARLFPQSSQVACIMLQIRDMTQLSNLERARRDMVANVSHELRTPLTSLKLLVETLQSEPPASVARRMLHQMAEEIDAVIQLSNELHELSQLEAGRVSMQLAPASIDTVIERALSRIHPQADRKRLDVEAILPDHATTILIDEQRIGQVLLNLLQNAVEFTNECGVIRVQACVVTVDEQNQCVGHIEQPAMQSTVLARSGIHNQTYHNGMRPVVMEPQTITFRSPHPAGLWMMVAVKDTGIGISARDLPRIFERFYKVDRARSRGGSGLGLAIARHLVEGHGGRLWVESEEGCGSTFYCTLPLV